MKAYANSQKILMKSAISIVGVFFVLHLSGCTFHPPTMSDLFDQNRLINEERIALRECERNSGAMGSITQCQQRAKSWRVPGQSGSSVQKTEPFEAKRQSLE